MTRRDTSRRVISWLGVLAAWLSRPLSMTLVFCFGHSSSSNCSFWLFVFFSGLSNLLYQTLMTRRALLALARLVRVIRGQRWASWIFIKKWIVGYFCMSEVLVHNSLTIYFSNWDRGTKLDYVSFYYIEGECLAKPGRSKKFGYKITTLTIIKVIFLRNLDLEAGATNRAHTKRDLIQMTRRALFFVPKSS